MFALQHSSYDTLWSYNHKQNYLYLCLSTLLYFFIVKQVNVNDNEFCLLWNENLNNLFFEVPYSKFLLHCYKIQNWFCRISFSK